MPYINYSQREIRFDVAYYGPRDGGKASNVSFIKTTVYPEGRKGPLVLPEIPEEPDAPYFLPAFERGAWSGFRMFFRVFCKGGPYAQALGSMRVEGFHSVVFVADSRRERLAENVRALDELLMSLRDAELPVAQLPIVFQYNKRDLPGALPVEELNARLNRGGWPTVEAVAVRGVGVFETLDLIGRRWVEEYERERDAED